MRKDIMSNTSRTNWDKIDAMTDDDIDISDTPQLTEEFFLKAKLRMPTTSISKVAVSIDSETLDWFRSKGKESEQHMAAALKIYAAVQKMAAGISTSI
jgi:uncharacterized protein (DUF4415 family)